MDVTCERCGTEYEFDETLIGDKGTSVKCTNCGYVFRVHRAEPTPAAGDSTSWTVRRRDGRTTMLASLGDLQYLILQRELSETDEISRMGESWKQLGDIAELKVFFHAAHAAEAAPGSSPGTSKAPARTTLGPAAAGAGTDSPFKKAPSSPPPTTSDRPSGPVQNTGARGSSPGATPATTASGRPRQPTLAAWGTHPSSNPPAPSPFANARDTETRPYPALDDESATAVMATTDAPTIPERTRGVDNTEPVELQAQEPAVVVSVGASGTAATVPDSVRPKRNTDSEKATVQAAPRLPDDVASPAGAAAAVGRRLYVDDEDESAWPAAKRKSSRGGLGWLFVLVLLAGGGAAAATQWETIRAKLGLGANNSELDGHISSAERALAEDEPGSYATADKELRAALAAAPKDLRARVDLATTHNAWAQALRFEADDATAQAERDPSNGDDLRADAARAREESAGHVKTARSEAEAAVRANGTDAGSLVALADALRLDGDLDEAKAHLARARNLEGEPSAEYHRVAALLEAAGESGDMRAARAEASRAVDADPKSIRSRLVLARSLLARNEVAAAREQLDAIFAIRTAHPYAIRLSEAIDKGLAPAPTVFDVVDAGAADGSAEGEAPTEAPAEAPASAPEAAADTTGGSAQAPAAAPGAAAPQGGARHDYTKLVESGNRALDRGDVSTARTMFLLAFDERPQGSEALTGLGYVALEHGDFVEALRRFEPAARNGFADAYIGLGETYRKLDRTEDALTAYRRYLERLPDGSSAGIARRQVAALEAKRAASKPAPSAPEAPEPESAPPSEAAPPPAPAPAPPAEAPPETDNPYDPAPFPN